MTLHFPRIQSVSNKIISGRHGEKGGDGPAGPIGEPGPPGKEGLIHRHLIYIGSLLTQPACLPLLTVVVMFPTAIKHALALYGGPGS